MKVRGMALLFVSTLFINSLPQEQNLEEIINQSDFVGFVKSSSSRHPDYDGSLVVMQSFKGEVENLRFRKVDITLEKDKEYLLMVTTDGELISRINFAPVAVNAVPRETIEVLNDLPCNGEPPEEFNRPGGCHRVYFPICGCDNITHGNICEMRKKGIRKFRKGECPGDRYKVKK